MTGSLLEQAPQVFIPETVTPPNRPFGTLEYFYKMLQNPLTVWPEAMFEETYLGVPWLGRTFHYLRDPAQIESVLLTHADAFDKSPFQRKLVGPAAGNGLLTSSGDSWKFQRRAASPAFRIDALRALVPTFATAGQTSAARLRSVAAGTTIDVTHEMQRATLEVITETILGGSDPGFEPGKVARSLDDYVNTLGSPDWLDLFNVPDWVPRPWGAKGRRAAADLHQAARNAIARRRASGDQRQDLLGLLLAARDPETGRGLSEQELSDNVVTFIAAGHETTALSLAYTLYLIANAPDIQDRLYAEALAACGDEPATAQALDQMPLHEWVIKEALRLYPPVALIDRVALRDVEAGGISYKKGDLAFAMVYVLHRHKKLWVHPERFDPERFSPQRNAVTHRCQFMPFGAGPRICIGLKFAYMEAVAILSELVRAVRFLPNPAHKVVPTMRLTLRPKGGMPLFVTAR